MTKVKVNDTTVTAKEWETALRSGRYQQVTDSLVDTLPEVDDWGYCCLGVLCEIGGAEPHDEVNFLKTSPSQVVDLDPEEDDNEDSWFDFYGKVKYQDTIFDPIYDGGSLQGVTAESLANPANYRATPKKLPAKTGLKLVEKKVNQHRTDTVLVNADTGKVVGFNISPEKFQSTLISLNDGGFGFDTIATVIDTFMKPSAKLRVLTV